MRLAELVIDFVPKDTFLIYASISREWRTEWDLRRFPKVTHVKYVVGDLNMFLWARRVHADELMQRSSRIRIDYTPIIPHVNLEVMKWLYKNDHQHWSMSPLERFKKNITWRFHFAPDDHHCNRRRCAWRGSQLTDAAMKFDRVDLLQWFYSERCEFDPDFVTYAIAHNKFPALEWAHSKSFESFPFEDVNVAFIDPKIRKWIQIKKFKQIAIVIMCLLLLNFIWLFLIVNRHTI